MKNQGNKMKDSVRFRRIFRVVGRGNGVARNGLKSMKFGENFH